jgi:hypothetical protein
LAVQEDHAEHVGPQLVDFPLPLRFGLEHGVPQMEGHFHPAFEMIVARRVSACDFPFTDWGRRDIFPNPSLYRPQAPTKVGLLGRFVHFVAFVEKNRQRGCRPHCKSCVPSLQANVIGRFSMPRAKLVPQLGKAMANGTETS